jgi:hypothetical protein
VVKPFDLAQVNAEGRVVAQTICRLPFQFFVLHIQTLFEALFRIDFFTFYVK